MEIDFKRQKSFHRTDDRIFSLERPARGILDGPIWTNCMIEPTSGELTRGDPWHFSFVFKKIIFNNLPDKNEKKIS